jgi:hypothetical protein
MALLQYRILAGLSGFESFRVLLWFGLCWLSSGLNLNLILLWFGLWACSQDSDFVAVQSTFKTFGHSSDTGFLLVLKGMLNWLFLGYRFTVLQRMLWIPFR